MPLDSTDARALLTRRSITCEGFAREDGLLDIEGHLVDVRGHDNNNPWRHVPAGSAVHDMWVRLTIDDALTIVRAESITDASPYPTCHEITPNTARLVGLKIAGGFKRKVHELIGHTAGCTHIVALIEAIATVAIQTIASKRRGMASSEQLSVFGARNPEKPPLIDTCHSYSADSPVTARMWPLHFRPRKGGVGT